MISIWHLIWIVPLSAVAGVILVFYLVILDDCLWWANKDNKGDDNRDHKR